MITVRCFSKSGGGFVKRTGLFFFLPTLLNKLDPGSLTTGVLEDLNEQSRLAYRSSANDR